MNVVSLAVVAATLVICAPALAQAPHPCAADAVSKARKLIRFHLADPGMQGQVADGSAARRVGEVAALKGKGKLDVLELTTNVYKASYRMRFFYARIPGGCTMLGQEIVEASDPY